MTSPVDTAIHDKHPRLLGVFLVTALIGVLLISIAVYRASQELEVIHEVDNMSRILRAMLGEQALGQLVRGERPREFGGMTGADDPAYRFFIVAENGLRPLQAGSADELRVLQSVDLESTRINERGGYFEADGVIRTWVKFQAGADQRALLVVHSFRSAGTGALAHVYRQRVIVPVAFYLWLTVWMALILIHLLRELRGQTARMKQMALHDALTGLPNRKLMQDRLAVQIQECRRDGRQFAFCVIDLNGFKAINDQHGHVCGDELLRQAGKRIAGALREADTVARYGGDEFTVLLSPTEESVWRAIFERIRASLNSPYRLSDAQVAVSASIGVAIFPVHGADGDTLLLNADRAMYAVKARGGGIGVFEPGAAGPGSNARSSGVQAGGVADVPDQP